MSEDRENRWQSRGARAHREGRWAEEVACAHLQQRGLTLVQRNYRCRYGELDLIMQDGDTLVFVEVRYRRDPVEAVESIDPGKQRKLCLAGASYLQNVHSSPPCRFDVLLVSGAHAAPCCVWLKAAFECDA